MVVAETSASDMHTQKSAKGREPRPFDLPLAVNEDAMRDWMLGLHLTGMQYLRSSDALGGI
jgi:hypothetical protein